MKDRNLYTFADVQQFHRDHIDACSRSGLHPMKFETFVNVHWPEFIEEYKEYSFELERWMAGTRA